jgi:hypothetical protein
VPGVGFSPDKMLQARIFSYADAHRYRFGTHEALASKGSRRRGRPQRRPPQPRAPSGWRGAASPGAALAAGSRRALREGAARRR